MADGTFKIVYTSDTHGYLFPTDYINPGAKPLGLLSCIHNYPGPKDGNTIQDLEERYV